jgi:hypothetical protein
MASPAHAARNAHTIVRAARTARRLADRAFR